jgi:uncharacterized membrane protein SirB2
VLEFYPEIRLFHISVVLMSGGLFLIRGVLTLVGWRYASHVVLRWLAYAIDCALLTAALMLITMLHQYPFVQDWLTVKLLLVMVYIGLGTFALRQTRFNRLQAQCYVAAAVAYLYMISVARAHHPLGIFHTLLY